MSKYIILTWSDCTNFSDLAVLLDTKGRVILFPSVQEAEWRAGECIAGEFKVVKIN